MLKKLCLTAYCLSSLFLTGCLSTSPMAPMLEWNGRFSLIAQNDSHKENHTGRFSLMQTTDQTQVLDLKTALGNTLARIEYADETVRIQAIGMDEVIGKDPEALMNQLLGFSVPIHGLAFWIDGEALPNVQANTHPAQAPYETIQQMGWEISYRQFDANGMPRRITFERQQMAQAPALKITLIILERRHGTP